MSFQVACHFLFQSLRQGGQVDKLPALSSEMGRVHPGIKHWGHVFIVTIRDFSESATKQRLHHLPSLDVLGKTCFLQRTPVPLPRVKKLCLSQKTQTIGLTVHTEVHSPRTQSIFHQVTYLVFSSVRKWPYRVRGIKDAPKSHTSAEPNPESTAPRLCLETTCFFF